MCNCIYLDNNSLLSMLAGIPRFSVEDRRWSSLNIDASPTALSRNKSTRDERCLLEALQSVLRLLFSFIKQILRYELMQSLRFVAYPSHLELEVLLLRVVVNQVDAVVARSAWCFPDWKIAETHMRAASNTASRVDNSASLSFSSSLFAN